VACQLRCWLSSLPYRYDSSKSCFQPVLLLTTARELHMCLTIVAWRELCIYVASAGAGACTDRHKQTCLLAYYSPKLFHGGMMLREASWRKPDGIKQWPLCLPFQLPRRGLPGSLSCANFHSIWTEARQIGGNLILLVALNTGSPTILPFPLPSFLQKFHS
jgi:hypothetical protein